MSNPKVSRVGITNGLSGWWDAAVTIKKMQNAQNIELTEMNGTHHVYNEDERYLNPFHTTKRHKRRNVGDVPEWLKESIISSQIHSERRGGRKQNVSNGVRETRAPGESGTAIYSNSGRPSQVCGENLPAGSSKRLGNGAIRERGEKLPLTRNLRGKRNQENYHDNKNDAGHVESHLEPSKQNGVNSKQRDPAVGNMGIDSYDDYDEGVCRGEVFRNQGTTQARWEQAGSLLVYTSRKVESRSKIAAFDIDDTIICTVSGKPEPTNYTDWRFLFPVIPQMIRQVHADGFKVVFFTNQAGIGKGRVSMREYMRKIRMMVRKLGAPVQVFVSTRVDEFTKPRLGMLRYLLERENDRIAMDLGRSYFVGDAAGRPHCWTHGRQRDQSSSDRLFALNARLAFFTPEEYFLAWKPAPFKMPAFDPRKFSGSDPLYSPDTTIVPADHLEVIVLVGYPACGKSFFVREHLIPLGYSHISWDNLYNWQECVKACHNALMQGRRVVIDGANADLQSRQKYIDISMLAGVACRCFLFAATGEHAKHNEWFRRSTENISSPNRLVTTVVIQAHESRFVKPTLREGFSEIVKVNFVPKFRSKELETQYHLYSSG